MRDREKDVASFYELLKQLEERVGGRRRLAECHRNMGWPERGVYFFFEEGETRSGSETDLRVVRVGTHAVTAKSKSRLWHRLYEHKQDGGRSVFRDHVNRALKKRAESKRGYRDHNHTRCISDHIRQMPFLWLDVGGQNGHQSRTRLERNAIALLSNWHRDERDEPSDSWLGKHSVKNEIKRSGLWNVQHVKGEYGGSFLEEMKNYVNQTGKLNEPADDWDSPVCVTGGSE